MLLSQMEIEEMKNRYPDEKPVAFNFMQARDDFLRLAEAYITLLNGSCSSATDISPRQSDKKKFIVLIDSSYVRDAQILPSNHYENEEDENGNPIDNESAWNDFKAEMLVGIYTACCREEAINIASEEEDIHSYKLTAYQIVD